MKISAKILYCALLILISKNYEIEAKGGRGGFGRGSSSRGGGWGGSKSSSSGGWFGSSRPSPSYSKPSPSYSYSYPSPSSSYTFSKPSPSYSAPSYGWNLNTNTNSRGTSMSSNSPSYGWNTANTGSNVGSGSSSGSKPNYGWNIGSNTANTGSNLGSKPNYGWNIGSNSNAPKPSAPVGPPPAYPGYQNRPIPNANSNLPPAYSPSYHNPPAYSYNPPSYSSGNNVYRTNTYNTYSSNPGYFGSSGMSHGYGQQFGSAGLGGNTYISNNYYGNRGGSSFGSGFLTNALFYGAGMHHGYSWGRSSNYYGNDHYYGSDHYRRREWNEDQDRRWRATTQAPYFANKVPGEDKILPASAVMGAATAFGLVSLLPLNVPANKPLMYCNNTELMQAQIRLEDGYIYQCINNTIEVTCPQLSNNSTVNEFDSTTPLPICENRLMTCSDDEISDEIYCKSGTLFSKENIFCNSTTLFNGTNINDTTTVLNCFKGELPNSQASFIPTTTSAPVSTTTTEKSLSIGAKIHLFFLKLVGKSDVLEKKETTTSTPDIPQLSISDSSWTPEALTIPPETTTTEGPYKWMLKVPKQFENGTSGFELQEVSEEILNAHKMVNNVSVSLGHEKPEATTMPSEYIKVYITTESSVQNSTINDTEISTSTEKASDLTFNEHDELDYTS